MKMEFRRVVTTRDDRGRSFSVEDAQLEWENHSSYPGVFRIAVDECESPSTYCGFTRIPAGAEVRMHEAHRGPGAPADNPAIEYNLVLSGEVDLMLDGGETIRIKAGGIHVLRGTTHGWRAVEDTVLASVLTWQPIDVSAGAQAPQASTQVG
jgi:hypothetical protein